VAKTRQDSATVLRRLSTYVPRHAVVRVCGGERISPGDRPHSGAVLVADLSGFTALSETYALRGRDGIDELTQLLNLIFTALLHDAVFPFDGYLVKFAGDALLATFEGEAHTRRACAAAQAAQEAMRVFASAAPGSRPLSIRIGIAAGDFHILTLGSRMGRLEILCAGDAAARALQAADLAGPKEVVLDGPGLPSGPFGEGSQIFSRIFEGQAPPRRQANLDLVSGLRPDEVDHAVAELKAFLPRDLFSAILEAPAASAGPAARRHACAVFAELGEWGQPVERLSASFDEACEAAERHGGAIHKVDGGARGPRLLAAFGLPSHEDDDRRALAFALELRDRLSAVGPRIGMESGPVFAGEVGSPLKREFTIMGDTVNVAARLTQVASQGQILCGPDCWSRVAVFTGRPTVARSLKGKREKVTAVEVLSHRRMTGSRLMQRIGHAMLVGREDELAALDEAARRALAGEVTLLRLIGPRGVGKSALVGVAVDRWIAQGGLALSARCEYDRRDQPYGTVCALVSALLGEEAVESSLTIEAARAAIAKIGIDDEELARLLAASTDRSPGAEAGLPAATRKFALRAVALIQRVMPFMVVVEDDHHIDLASVQVLANLIENLGPARLFVLAAARPEPAVLERLKTQPGGALDVRPLERSAARTFLARSLSAHTVSDRLEQAVDARAKGNPFVVLRLSKWLLAQGLLERVGERVDLSTRAADDPSRALPPDLEALVHAEVDALSSEAREVLRTVCVLGPQFGNPLAVGLCEAAGLDRKATLGALERLSRDGLLVITGGAEPIYRFARLIDREVIYAGLPLGVRRSLHARVAALLREQGVSRERLAVHYDAADDHENAAEGCLEAARTAFRRGAAADALRLYRAAVRHRAAMGKDPTECHVAEIECLCVLASYGEARKLAVALAETLPSGPARTRALISAAKCASHEGDHVAAHGLNRRAREDVPREDSPSLRASFHVMCAINHYSVGRPAEALEEVEAARALSGPETLAVVLGMRAGLLVEMGRSREALSAATEARVNALANRHRGNLALTLVYLGRALDASGDKAGGRARYLEAERIYGELNQPVNAANAALHAAEMDLELGDPQGALTQLLPVLETSRHFAAGQLETAALCSAGRARLLLGQRAEAIRDLSRAIELCETTLEHHAAICGRAYLAEALWSEDRPRAEAFLALALRTGRERGLVLELAGAQAVAARLGFAPA
jgi:class 3 adenylate cyclase/tetratricopeptide (TPR) repeat protein